MTDQSDTELTFTTSTGRVLTEADLEALADEFAATETVDLDAIKRRGRPRLGNGESEVLRFRVDRELAEALRTRAAVEHATNSELIREALVRFLAS